MTDVIIIGGGPAGLTAAYELAQAGRRAVVLEKDTVLGGIARTVNYKGYRFDIGGHRFFTKVPAVERFWRAVLADSEFLRRDRLSRIYYTKKFFFYPLRAWNALSGLGFWNSLCIVASYVWAQLFPIQPELTFEQWVTNRFGARLYRTFFKSYTEKVWGIPCDQISAEWAAQRIKGLSLLAALKNALLQQPNTIKTLIDAFDYPRLGPGQMWETVATLIQAHGHEIRSDAPVEKIHWTAGRVTGVETDELVTGSYYLSSMPLRELIEKLSPAAPAPVRQAAAQLHYRDFLTVALIVNRRDVFPDNWIYIHDPDVKMGRIQNFKNWSPDMVPDQNKTCLGLEYFCFAGDGLWTMPDAELIELAKRELEQVGLARAAEVEDGTVVRMPKAYPVYDGAYGEHLAVVREFLGSLENLQVIGRNGMHKYNNQDHSMYTAMLAVKNICGGRYNLWQVNADAE
ncbi:MAG: NAD(P)/FAD-dependent oxidoreductase, partial [Verrucomicrobiota bacterium]